MALSVGPKDERDIDDCSSGVDEIDEIDLKDEVVWERITENYPENTIVWLGNSDIWDEDAVNWYDADTKTTGSWTSIKDPASKNIWFGNAGKIKNLTLYFDVYVSQSMYIACDGYDIDYDGHNVGIDGNLELNYRSIHRRVTFQVAGDIVINAETEFDAVRTDLIKGSIVGNGTTLKMTNCYLTQILGDFNGLNLITSDTIIDVVGEVDIPSLKVITYTTILLGYNLTFGYIDISECKYSQGCLQFWTAGDDSSQYATITEGINFGTLCKDWIDGYLRAPIFGYDDYGGCGLRFEPTNEKIAIHIDVDNSQLATIDDIEDLQANYYLTGNSGISSTIGIEDIFDLTDILAMEEKITNAYHKLGGNSDMRFMCELFAQDGCLRLSIVKCNQGLWS